MTIPGSPSLSHVPPVSGVVLAGGRSSRFGVDKLGAVVEGRPLLHRSIESLAAVSREVIVVLAPGAPDPELPLGLLVPTRTVRDAEPFGGPLVGIMAALDVATEPVALVAGADMPWLEHEVLELLVRELTLGGADAVALASAGYHVQLPCAVNVVVARPVAARLVAGGERSITALLRELRTGVIGEERWRLLDPEGRSLRDVDRPSDLEAIDGRPPGQPANG